MIIGIGGASRSGKSTLARLLVNYFRDSGKTAIVVYQDDYVFPTEQIPLIRDKVDWESPKSINHALLLEIVTLFKDRFDVVIVDGFLTFYNEELVRLFDSKIFVQISNKTYLQRKEQDLRWGDIPRWYFGHIWESYEKYGIPDMSDGSFQMISGETTYDLDSVLQKIQICN